MFIVREVYTRIVLVPVVFCYDQVNLQKCAINGQLKGFNTNSEMSTRLFSINEIPLFHCFNVEIQGSAPINQYLIKFLLLHSDSDILPSSYYTLLKFHFYVTYANFCPTLCTPENHLAS